MIKTKKIIMFKSYYPTLLVLTESSTLCIRVAKTDMLFGFHPKSFNQPSKCLIRDTAVCPRVYHPLYNADMRGSLNPTYLTTTLDCTNTSTPLSS